jgi:hypothetical protein
VIDLPELVLHRIGPVVDAVRSMRPKISSNSSSLTRKACAPRLDRLCTSLVVERHPVRDLDGHEPVEGRGIGQAQISARNADDRFLSVDQTIVWFNATVTGRAYGRLRRAW